MYLSKNHKQNHSETCRHTRKLFPHGGILYLALTGLSISCYPFAAAADNPVFNLATDAGIDVSLSGSWSTEMGGGAAWIDFDNDDDPDLFVPTPALDQASYLYRNDGGSFVEIAQEAGVELLGHACTGAAVGDINNDGWDDIYVTCGTWNPDPSYPNAEVNALFLNNKDGTFTDITVSAGLIVDFDATRSGIQDPSYAAAFGDIDGDGDLDLYVGNYETEFWDINISMEPYLCASNNLFINDGQNPPHFVDMAQVWGVDDGNSCPLSVVLSDYDHDGDLDIFVMNLGGSDPVNSGLGTKNGVFGTQTLPPNEAHHIFRNDGNGQFVEVSSLLGMNDPSDAMGIAIGDYDNDNDLDYYVTDVNNEFLYTNNGMTFMDKADPPPAGAGATQTPGFSWGTVFFDPDNDGYSDIYAVHGGMAGSRRRSEKPNKLFMNNGNATFTEAGSVAGLDDNSVGRGVVVADYDGDGDEDIFVTNISGDPNLDQSRLYRNDTPRSGHNSLVIKLTGVTSNRRGIGAKVRVTTGQGINSKTQLKEVNAGSGHGSTNDLTRVHFGLGSETFATLVTVEWPSGCVQVLSRVNTGVQQITENCQ